MKQENCMKVLMWKDTFCSSLFGLNTLFSRKFILLPILPKYFINKLWKNMARKPQKKPIWPLTVIEYAHFEKLVTDYNFLIKGSTTKFQENH